MTTDTTASRTIEGLTRLDECLSAEGKRDVFEAIAIKEVLTWQIDQKQIISKQDK